MFDTESIYTSAPFSNCDAGSAVLAPPTQPPRWCIPVKAVAWCLSGRVPRQFKFFLQFLLPKIFL